MDIWIIAKVFAILHKTAMNVLVHGGKNFFRAQ